MRRKIITTADGSKTIHIEEWNEQYHSKHGAIREAYHVFIKNGLFHLSSSKGDEETPQNISVLEIGFGTGLNAFISCLEADKLQRNINYVGVEAYPVSKEEIASLNYVELISKDAAAIFEKLHEISWGKPIAITSNFKLEKRQQFFSEIEDIESFDLIYFDAFGARVQPELWTEAIFEIMFSALKSGGVLVTYSAKGSVRRAMQSVGFTVERLEGPPGKREMLRATKFMDTLKPLAIKN